MITFVVITTVAVKAEVLTLDALDGDGLAKTFFNVVVITTFALGGRVVFVVVENRRLSV